MQNRSKRCKHSVIVINTQTAQAYCCYSFIYFLVCFFFGFLENSATCRDVDDVQSHIEIFRFFHSRDCSRSCIPCSTIFKVRILVKQVVKVRQHRWHHSLEKRRHLSSLNHTQGGSREERCTINLIAVGIEVTLAGMARCANSQFK